MKTKQFRSLLLKDTTQLTYDKQEILKHYEEKEEKIVQLLDKFQDYEALMQTIFINSHFFVSHFDEIQTWLESKEFNKKFLSKLSLYPSLIDPKTADYNKLGADLAWDLNLPLNYTPKLVWMSIQSSGTMMNILATELLNKKRIYTFDNNACGAWNADGFWDNTNRLYKFCLQHKPEIITVGFRNFKFFHLLLSDTKVAYIVRDPISLFRLAVNHVDNEALKKGVTDFTLAMDWKKNDIFAKISYYGNKDKPDINRTVAFKDKGWFGFCFDFYKTVHVLENLNITPFCLEFTQISPENAFHTYKKLQKLCGFHIEDEKTLQNLLSHRINRFEGSLISLPVRLHAHEKHLEQLKNDSFFEYEGGVDIFVSTHALHPNKTEFIDLTKKIFQTRKLLFENIIILVKRSQIHILESNKELFTAVQTWLHSYMDSFEENEKNIKEKLYDENQILEYLHNEKELALKLKESLDCCYKHIKEKYPHYLKKWKYYQKFEKLCHDLESTK
ncbi:DUF2972 domain-containing protein [Campylobacter sp. MIT 21-1685]|uniref:DUF2972 domain-containing protein n=1 Tax=unclassified Campylobacter TaxID=2593542 RepID=UPI00224B874C|nr:MULTISPECIES: DUF2972 domain-containing protein [unclassified Campylobacter]MCX2682896.1 DUF2972 domain-containing protein [Campylobacter sp. MIT 21-1684]MCX2751156.1 DUF2972 domain-containing protein [Campylobacter sp. MIT 21-1682]MCX2807377.1 DUF2972 domain-containing protein [Campylobacter sp. MIT 21-1685]